MLEADFSSTTIVSNGLALVSSLPYTIRYLTRIIADVLSHLRFACLDSDGFEHWYNAMVMRDWRAQWPVRC